MFKRFWGGDKERKQVSFKKWRDWVARRQRQRMKREMKKARDRLASTREALASLKAEVSTLTSELSELRKTSTQLVADRTAKQRKLDKRT